MKRKVLSLLMAFCLMLSLAPAAFAVDASTAANPITVSTETDLQNAVSANANYDLVTLGSDITLTSTLSINRGVTISGGSDKHTLTYNGTAANGAVAVNTNDPVVMDNLIVTVTNAQTRGIKLATTSPKFTFSNSELNASFRGIWVDTSCDSNSVITVSNSTIQNNQIPEDLTYDNWAACTDTRGIALWDMNNSKVEIINSNILGFGYSVNLTGTLDEDTNIRDYNNTEIIVTDSTIKGWTAFNVWSAKTIFTITDSTLKGINVSNGSSDGFATIVVNDDIYGHGWGRAFENVFTIKGSTITNYQGGSATENLFRVDSDGITSVEFLRTGLKKVQFKDTTGNVYGAFYSPLMTVDEMTTFVNDRVTGHENCSLIAADNSELAWGAVINE